MRLSDIRIQLEEDLSWRSDEIRLLRNQLAYIKDEEDQLRYRKALVVMLYSHYEGFCKAALSIYADAINQENTTCGDVTECIAAASLAHVFKEFDNPFKKASFFKDDLPNDSELHRFARQAELLYRLGEVWKQPVSIPTEVVVDTESNLKPIVLRKILYRLGFTYNAFKDKEASINELLNRRNNIAHGVQKLGIDANEYEGIEKITFSIMDALLRMIVDALNNKIYKKELHPTTD